MAYSLGLVGHPISHSLSPWIHQNLLKKAVLEGTYTLYNIPVESFSREIEKLKGIQLDGFNVTVPYKQAIMRHLDEVDSTAKRVEAVNTVACRNGKWIGYNTDGSGYIRSLRDAYPDIFLNKSIRIILIGAGGAARGIYDALVQNGFYYIDIANRTTDHAVQIKELGNTFTETTIYSLDKVKNGLDGYDLIIQTTSVGMKPNDNEIIMVPEKVTESSIVSDIVYQPICTRMLQIAKRKKASVHYGHTMLLYQAQHAFEIWTGKQITVEDLKEPLQKQLEGR
ncbi:shikimate dehydrogenase [Oceanobacillus halotolerans]|uniref:shikimate dehydrogenase n=1 Tax=Oceanobacillus halotolerans TaxID=2663380 RepID=UPI0013DCAA8A|nr:shikimate dehydrogenase [Oceanobacillus halotolerans]